MKKIAVAIAVLIYPVFLFAAEIKGTVLKLVPAENRIVLKTERGEADLAAALATEAEPAAPAAPATPPPPRTINVGTRIAVRLVHAITTGAAAARCWSRCALAAPTRRTAASPRAAGQRAALWIRATPGYVPRLERP